MNDSRASIRLNSIFLAGDLSTNRQPQLAERVQTTHHEYSAQALIMDPLTALSLCCNVIDLVSTAISCGLAVKDIYKSVDGSVSITWFFRDLRYVSLKMLDISSHK